MIVNKTLNYRLFIKNIKFNHIIKRYGSGVGKKSITAIDKIIEKIVNAFKDANARATTIKIARDKNNITLFPLSKPRTPLSTQPKTPLFNETQRNTPEYHRALTHRFPPINRPRIFDHPSFNSLLLGISSFMRQYYNTAYNNIDSLITAFRHIQFDPHQIHSRMYNSFMILFNRLNNLLYGQNTIENNPQTSSTSTTTTSTTTTSSTSSTTTASQAPVQNTYILLSSGTKSHIPINTKIFTNMSPSNITFDELLEEMRFRFMLKKADKTHTSVKSENQENITVGQNEHNFKATQLGQAYLNLTEEPIFSDEKVDFSNVTYKIAVLPKSNDALLVTGKQKHLVVVLDQNTDKCYIIGFLTSQASKILINDKQFKKFQEEKLSGIKNDSSKTQKSQYFHEFENAESIAKDELTFILWGEEYLINVQKAGEIEKIAKKVSEISIRIYNKNNYTKEQLIQACQMHDENDKNNRPHPKTKDQSKIEEENIRRNKVLAEETKHRNKMKTENKNSQQKDESTDK